MHHFADEAYLMGLDDSEEECPLDFDDAAALAAVSAVRAESSVAPATAPTR